LAGSGESAPDVHASQKGVFRKEGDYWTVGYGGKSYRLKDAKGLAYIAHLLRYPDLSFHVLDLVGGIPAQTEKRENNQSAQGLPRGGEDLERAGIHVGGLGDAGEMLDDQAKAAYRRRLSELREELEEAKEAGNVAQAEQAEEEIDALTRELSRAVGLSGRNRRAASASERARQSVTKTIKTVMERGRAERCDTGRYPIAMHQNRDLLHLQRRSGFSYCMGVCRAYRVVRRASFQH
jgi:hypothetical protein